VDAAADIPVQPERDPRAAAREAAPSATSSMTWPGSAAGTASAPSRFKARAHVAPLGWEHISLTGDYDWAAAAPPPGGFRPLRDVRAAFLPLAA